MGRMTAEPSLPHGFAERLRAMGDGELLEMLVRADDYLPPAVALAREEAARRGLSPASLDAVKAHVAEVDAAAARRADEPLSTMERLLLVLMPLNLWLILRMVAHGGFGYERRAREARRWMLYGVAIWIAVAVVVALMIDVRGPPR